MIYNITHSSNKINIKYLLNALQYLIYIFFASKVDRSTMRICYINISDID